MIIKKFHRVLTHTVTVKKYVLELKLNNNEKRFLATSWLKVTVQVKIIK